MKKGGVLFVLDRLRIKKQVGFPQILDLGLT